MHLFSTFCRWLHARRRASRTEGQTLVEYSLVLAVISILALTVFTALGNRIVYVFSAITNLLDTAQAP